MKTLGGSAVTSPVGGGSEHISRYRALGEFDNLVRAAREAKRALKELREEEAKLNAQSLEADKKIAASKDNRARAEQANADVTTRALQKLKDAGVSMKTGEEAGLEYNRGVSKGLQKGSQSSENKRFVEAAANALKDAFAKAGTESGKVYTRNVSDSIKKETNSVISADLGDSVVKNLKAALAKAGDESGGQFLISVRERFKKDSEGTLKSSGFEYSLRQFVDRSARFGTEAGISYVNGYADKLKTLNTILPTLGHDKLDLDVDTKDAEQSILALEFELQQLSHTTAEPRVRIDSTRALEQLRFIKKLFKDEVAEEMVKDSERIQKELEKLDKLPSGKSFKFWALTALSDMSRVFEQAEKGTSIFERLRKAASDSGSGESFFKSFVDGFDKLSESSSNVLQRLSRVSGELYRMPGLIAVLVSAIPALVAGVAALGGGALGLASGLGAVSGALAAFPGVLTAIIGITGGLKGAFGEMGEAIKAANKAQEDELATKEQARLGTDKALTSQQKYKLAMEQLSPTTKQVTEDVLAFAEGWRKTQEVVGENFFKEVVDQTGKLTQLLPVAESFFGKSATALGKVADQGIRMITSGPWKADFAIIAENNADVITNMGLAGLSLIEVFKNITVAAGPFTTWITDALREGADSFADWSMQARSNGTIAKFLNDTTESLQSLWQILKNLGNVVNSFFQSTVDEGQRYLRTLEDITGGWAQVAEAQEQANSPLRRWMTEIRPVLSALGALIADLASGIAGLATNQNSITAMIDLLEALRTDVLPPILKILQQLNDSGIAATVVEAIGGLLEAISDFLESGAAQALTVFVTVLSEFAQVVFGFASLPVVSDALGGLASALAALAAVSIVARFTGLFKLWDFFTWMSRNRGNLSGAFADAARGVAGLPALGQNQVQPNIPSSIGGIGSEVLGNQARATERVGTASQNSAGKVDRFSRSVAGITAAGGAARGALGGLVGFLGGPWGIALVAATAGIGALIAGLSNQKQEAQDTKDAFLALKNAYGDLSEGNTEGVTELANTSEEFKKIVNQAKEFKLTLSDVSGAMANSGQDLTRVNEQLDAQIASYEGLRIAAVDAYGPGNDQAILYRRLKNEATEYKKSINDIAAAQKENTEATDQSIAVTRTYEERLGGLTQAQVDSKVKANDYDSQIRILSGALDTLSSATSNSTDRSKALGDILQHETGAMINAQEASENYSSAMLGLEEAVKNNGKSLSINSREGLRNRDALQAAAGATRDLFLQEIAAGKPMDEVTKKHQERIKELKEEAKRLGLNREETAKLIQIYGEVPKDLQTTIKSDEKGFQQVYADLLQLQIIQTALREGKSPEEAERQWKAESGKLYRRPPTTSRGGGRGNSQNPNGDGPGFANGGPVWGPGTRTSDSIRAWLSNGEFVHPTDAVEHYGMPIMEAIRSRKLDKAAIQEALPENGGFSSGGHAHSANCPSCSSGGHKFASGGRVNIPIVVDPSKTMIDKNWASAGLGFSDGDLGNASGSGGWRWQMQVLRKQFPGLDLWSGYRPGSRTLSGNRSYHAAGRAVDIAPRRDVAAWIRNNYGSRTKELITPFNDLNLHNGRPHRYTGAVWNQHNFAGGNAHNHWAFRNGGLVDIMNMLGMNNMMTNQQNELPSTPRTLSPAASSVVNNANDNNSTNFGDIIINNPTPERGGDSIRNALYRTQLLL